jgi:hypothetical protein
MNSPVLSQHTNAALLRLKHASSTVEFGQILKELLEHDEGLDRVAEITERRIGSGGYVLIDQLASLVLRTKSSSLYAKAREQLFADDWALLTLYKGQYPDSAIEKRLCDRIYQTASDDAEPRRRYIADAMRDVGSECVLPTLEAILFDLKPTVQVKQILAEASKTPSNENPREFSHQLLYRLEASSRAKFVGSVALAIDAIKGRITAPEKSGVQDSQSEVVKQVDEANNAEWAKEQARLYIDGDPITSTIYVRIGAEALGKDLYRALGHEKSGKPARKMTLEELLKPVKDSDAPEVFKLILQALQLFGNCAAHDQDDQSKYLTKDVASAVLALYEQAQMIYREWSKLRR